MTSSSTLHRIASVASVVVLAVLVGVVYFAKRNRPFSRGPAPKQAPAPPENSSLPTIPEVERKPLPPATTGGAEEVRPEPRVDAALDRERGERSRQQWDWWKKALAQERIQKLRHLAELLELAPGHVTALHTYFEAEDSAWEKDMEGRLQPAFEGGGAPSYAFLTSDAYRAWVAELTAATNASVRALLHDEQWTRYVEWRTTYNQGRFFVSEGK